MTGPGAPTPPASIEVFYAYAHEDEELVKELQKHLSILKWQGVIREWYDREITAGTDWKGQLDQHLNSSGIILLLVSADFLASKYCYDVEMRRALERHDQGEARVIPVLLRMVDGWQGAPFGKLQSLPTDGKPVTSWKICDEAFADVARGIRNAIGQLGVLQPPVGTTPVGQAFWNVPHPRNPSFTGREAEIAGLRERLDRKRKTALAQAISGLGGIGKTQTAVEYAYRYRDEYKAVLWVDADSTLSLKSGCSEIARQMPLRHDEKDLDQAAAAVKYWLGTHPDWLLILDNADDPAVLKPFLPTDHEGHILITSRAQDFQHLGILDPVELGELPIEDATAFLLRRCGREGADEAERGAARELAGELDGLPLALEQATAYIVATRATFQRYLESYRTRGLARLEARQPALGRYPKSVATTWAANFEAVQADSEAAADVLRLSAFLAPDAIPFELLTRGVSQLGPALEAALSSADPLVVRDVLLALDRFSLVRVDGERETFGIHRIVQEVLKLAMADALRRLCAERAVRAVNQAFPAVEYANWPLCDRLLPQALAVVPWIERDRMEFAEAGRLLNQTAFYLHDRGQYAQAEPLLKQATEILRTALGEGHPDYAASLDGLAGLCCATGRYAEAEPLYRRALEVRRAALGEGHPDYAASLDGLAGLCCATGRYAEAEPLYRRALEVRRAALGEGHPDYAASLDGLAGLRCATGRYAEAEPLYRRALEVHRAAPGESHPAYAASLTNLAGLYDQMGRYAEAEPLYRQALELYGQALSERHPAYATTLDNLAGLCCATGRYAEAEPLYRRALEVRRAALGEGHPDYATSLSNLAGLCCATGRYAEAEPLYRRALEVRRAALGEGHPDYATSLSNLAGLCCATGRYAEAEPLYRRALEVRRAALGEGHPDYAASLGNLALLLYAMDRHSEAETLCMTLIDKLLYILK